MQTLLPRRSLSTELEHVEWLRGVRVRYPRSNISHIVITLADGTMEYYPGHRCYLRRAYLNHPEGSANFIIHVRWITQPLHLLTDGGHNV
jgi:hypothetical protein